MPTILEDISQVTIFFKNEKDQNERVNEVSLYQPLTRKPELDESSPPLHQRKWSFSSSLPFSRRVVLKIQSFFFKKLPFLITEERQSVEAKFKTVLAILLSQEALADFFLNEEKERINFFDSIQEAAYIAGLKDFSLPPKDFKPYKMARFLTKISNQNRSLLDDIEELNLQIAILDKNERDDILFNILNNIKRPPITSVIEVDHGKDKTEKVSLTTIYGKYKVTSIDEQTGKINFIFTENQAQASIKSNSQSSVINQHLVFDTTNTPHFLAGISGELLNHYRVLEQILFLLQENGQYFIEKFAPNVVEEKTFVFTSLFSWNEYEKIMDEYFAIVKLHGKVLKLVKDNGEVTYFRLSLHHQNIPFNAFNKFPAPAELKASINDLNDKTLLVLSDKILNYAPLHKLAKKYNTIREEIDLIRKENDIINCIDRFNQMKDELLRVHNDTAEAIAIKVIISKKLPNGKPLHAIDTMIYFSIISKHLGFIHNINCEHATDRAAGALSVVKAQNAFVQVVGKPYLPGLAAEEEDALFRVLYSMYLVFEEPELNTGLCTGFIGEKYYQNFIQKNPETTFYLIPWLKEHPEMYLGLSNYRD